MAERGAHRKEARFPRPPRLRVREAAQYLGVSARSLASRAWRIRHRIPTLRIGRVVVFDPVSLDRWIARHAERPQTPVR